MVCARYRFELISSFSYAASLVPELATLSFHFVRSLSIYFVSWSPGPPRQRPHQPAMQSEEDHIIRNRVRYSKKYYPFSVSYRQCGSSQSLTQYISSIDATDISPAVDPLTTIGVSNSSVMVAVCRCVGLSQYSIIILRRVVPYRLLMYNVLDSIIILFVGVVPMWGRERWVLRCFVWEFHLRRYGTYSVLYLLNVTV